MAEVPDYSDEYRQSRLTNIALQRLEELMLSGDASPSVLLYFARQGDLRSRAELELTRANVKVANARTRVMDEQVNLTAMYSEAMNALRTYTGGYNGEDSENLQ